MTNEYIIGRKRITNERYRNIHDAVTQLGKHFASDADVIAVRNKAPLNAPVWNFYGWTRGMRLIAPRGEPYLFARKSILLTPKLAQKAVESNANSQLFYPGNEVYKQHLGIAEKEEKAGKLPEKRTVMILPTRDTFLITADNYFDVLRFQAKGRKPGKDFLAKLAQKNLQGVKFYLPGSDWVEAGATEPFVQQSWFNGLAHDSDFCGNDRNLGNTYGAFGVVSVADEVGARKIYSSRSRRQNSEHLSCTSRQLKKVIGEAEGARKNLGRVVELLRKLNKH